MTKQKNNYSLAWSEEFDTFCMWSRQSCVDIYYENENMFDQPFIDRHYNNNKKKNNNIYIALFFEVTQTTNELL